MSPDRTSRSLNFFPLLGVVVFKYIGVLAGILLPRIQCVEATTQFFLEEGTPSLSI